jgi:nucleotide-binding universal stress UspA family protein
VKILIGTDGSDHSRLAEVLVAKLPSAREAEVIVATVATPPALGMSSLGAGSDLSFGEGTALAWDVVRERATATLNEAADRLRGSGLNVRTELLQGETANELLAFAESEAVDLIAVGSRGMGAVKSFFLGSVARRLLNHAHTHVLIARSPEDTGDAEYGGRISAKDKLSVMVCYDGSEGARLALSWICDQGEGAFREARCVCAEPLTVVPPGVDPSVFGQTYGYDRERAEGLAAEGAEALKFCAEAAIPGTVLGRSADALIGAAGEHDVDLVVIGATRHGAIERFLLGSVSYEVATHTPCSVVIVRPKERGEE